MQPIHWFPGHMAKAKRQIQEALALVDVVTELVDARLPQASANPMLRQIAGQKPRAVVMTRIDLADPLQTRRWEWFLQRQGAKVVGVDARSGEGVRALFAVWEEAVAEKRARERQRGLRPRPVRTMVVGIPNVGKSSLINRLAGRAATKTGDLPGVTKAAQWIRLGHVELLDTPGVLWPKLDDEHTAYKLAVSGAIKSEVLDIPSVCAYFLLFAARHYPQLLQARYGLTELPQGTWTDAQTAWEMVEPVLQEIARRRGMLRQGGVPDAERASELVLREVQTGRIGRMTFEWAPQERLDEAARKDEPGTEDEG
ncbi:ribosome biogenesis GTPase YlqF [Alicyclobacillus cellulosilyticus]|nr:ribosome biogenesis GTPase YlqF [Alicyclobacillus cellulosilyticus]